MTISANIATQKSRRKILPKMLDSIRGQFDVIRVYANDYEPDLEGVEVRTGDDIADNGKFAFLNEAGDDEIYFTLDDDIQYPPNYVQWTLFCRQHYKKAITTYHGRKLVGKGRSYYHGHKVCHCQRPQEQDQHIDVPGTGVASFRIKDFRPTSIADSFYKRMADVLCGLEAAKQGIDVISLKHPFWWIQTFETPDAIYKEEHNNDSVQSALADHIWGYRYE